MYQQWWWRLLQLFLSTWNCFHRNQLWQHSHMCWWVVTYYCLINVCASVFFQDVDECSDISTCGLGVCINNFGAFYQCVCLPGAVITGTNTDSTLKCVGKIQQFLWEIQWCPPLPLSIDLDECNEMPGRCGLGTCRNNENAMFYDCICQDGAMMNGFSTAGTLTCIGKPKWHTCSFMDTSQ